MPAFETPEPISATVELALGDLRIVAGDRDDTVVEVRPSDPVADARRRAAEQTRVEYADGHLLVKAPKQRGARPVRPARLDRRHDRPARRLPAARRRAGRGVPRHRPRSASAGSRPRRRLQLDATARCASNRRRRDRGRPVRGPGRDQHRLRQGPGRRDRRPGGGQELQRRQLDRRASPATCGSTRPTATSPSTGPTPTSSPSTANGDIRIGEVDARRGRRSRPAFGEIEVGIRDGTAAWLDVHTSFGRVRNELETLRGHRRRRRDRRGARPHRLRRHHRSAAPDRDAEGGVMTTIATRPAITVTGLRKSFGDNVVLDGIDLTSPRARSSRCSGRTAPARPPRCRSCHADPRRRRRGARSPATTSPPSRTRCAPRSASPASSPRSTTCSPARRTCC